jgi:hypothetical protein
LPDLRVLSLAVGGVVLRASAEKGGLPLRAAGGIEPFLIRGDGPADVELVARLEDLEPTIGRGSLVFDSGGTWEARRVEGQEVLSFRALKYGQVPYRQLRLDEGGRTGEIVYHRPYFNTSEVLEPFHYPVDELLTVRCLAQGAGVELHSLGVETSSGQGFLFAGQSGDGKTTMARLWDQVAGARILSDDRIIVRRDEGSYRIHGTPWHGEADFAVNRSVPLSAVFILGKAPVSALVPLSRGMSAALLLARAFLPFHSGGALEGATTFLGAMTAVVPCMRFDVFPDAGAPALVLGAFDIPGSRQEKWPTGSI